MLTIPIILGSTRRDRQTPKVSKYIHRRLLAIPNLVTEVLDLGGYNFPVMEERLRLRDDPPPRLQEFSAKINAADSIVIVTPEYNHGYPGVLKNALDYLLPEYERKPFGIVTVSAGGFGGIHCLSQLRLVVFGLGGFPIIESLTVSRVQDSFDDNGNPKVAGFDKRADDFFEDLLFFTEAVVGQKKKKPGVAIAPGR